MSGRPQCLQRLTPTRGAPNPNVLLNPRQNRPGATALPIMPTSAMAPRKMMTALIIIAQSP